MWKPHPAKIRATLGGFTRREKIALSLDTTENLYVGSSIYTCCRFWLTPVICTYCRYQVPDEDGARPFAANLRQPEESARKNAWEEGDGTEGDSGGRGRSRSLDCFLGWRNNLFQWVFERSFLPLYTGKKIRATIVCRSVCGGFFLDLGVLRVLSANNREAAVITEVFF